MARSTQLVGGTLPMKWSSSTINTAKPRTPSSTGRCPCRLSPGLARVGTPGVAASPGLGGGGTCACADITPTLSGQWLAAHTMGDSRDIVRDSRHVVDREWASSSFETVRYQPLYRRR